MNFLGITLILGLFAGLWAQMNVIKPKCDSFEAEEAALVAQDYLNAQHTHGYKYALNRVEDIKIYTKPDGDIYVLEVDLLETNCHVLDPTPLANCTVRPKISTAIEGDCDVVLKKVGGALTVLAFKCKTDESTEDLCVGCATLLPLNDTAALDFVQASLATFNNRTVNVTYAVKEVGRMSSKVGPETVWSEYVIAEANCTEDACTPLHDLAAPKMKPNTAADSNSTAAMPSVVHIHLSSQSPKHGLKHHKLTALHDPHQNSISGSSSDSSASAEVPVVVVKRDLPAATIASVMDNPITPVPVCPGRKITHFCF
uniref:Alpha-2-HS-glycoprotein 2 n=1 Tax=Gasterosteus aculeatus TaxID=69293 RepID=G3PUE5_GASAC